MAIAHDLAHYSKTVHAADLCWQVLDIAHDSETAHAAALCYQVLDSKTANIATELSNWVHDAPSLVTLAHQFQAEWRT